jgi:hypothetical protein
MTRILAGLVLALSSIPPLAAQSSDTASLRRAINALSGRLFSANTFDCRFTLGTAATWLGPFDRGSDSTPKLESDNKAFVLTFTNIDTITHTATMVGNNGSGPVGALRSGPALTFLERTMIGYVTVTTVFATYAKGTMSFIATHSRHIGMGIATMPPLPSQSHGTCTVR